MGLSLAFGTVVLGWAVAGAPVDAVQMRTDLGGTAGLTTDADGTVSTAVGFRLATGASDPTVAARSFVSRFGSQLGLHSGLVVSGVRKVARGHVVRLHEVVNGLPVMGGGLSLVVESGGTVTMALRGARVTGTVPSFRLSALEAADAALKARPAFLPAAFTRDVLGAMARPAYWARPNQPLAAVFLLDLPSIYAMEARRVAVNAADGSVLQSLPLALQENVPGRAYDPNPGEDGTDAPVDVTLNVNQDAQNLRGPLLETFNCCKRVECLEQGDGGCARLGCVSAADGETGTESRVPFTIPTSLLPIPPQLAQFCTIPDPLYVDSVFCGVLPRAQRTGGGFAFTPVDKASPANDALASEEDAFAEAQVYHHLSTFQQHVRTFSGDAEFCLHSQECVSGVAQKPFHVEVNGLLPELNQDSLQALACQVCAIPGVQGCGGRGASPATPVLIDKFMRMDNAYFQPATDSSQNPFPVDIPGLVSDFDKNVFFQGTTRDFAYDGDVVYHEFTHAIIHTVVENGGQPAGLNGYIRDRWGVRNEAGALNEGLSDFFSQSFTDDPVTGEYAAAGLVQGETGIRNAGNLFTCPDNTTGQVHDDSRAWSSALWAARTALVGTDAAKARTMEGAIFTVTSALPADASFAQATTAAKAALKAAFSGQDAAIDAAFESRGVTDCQRFRHVLKNNNGTLETTPVEYLQFAGKQDVGLTNHAPGHMQLRLDLPPRTLTFRLQFSAQGGGILGQVLGGGEDENDIEVVFKADTPIVNTYTATTAAHDGITETVTPDMNGNADVSIEVAGGGGLEAAKTYFVGFNVLAANGVTVRDIAVSVTRAAAPDAGAPVEDAGTGGSSSSSSSSSSGGAGGGGDAPADNCACAQTPTWQAPGALALAGLILASRRRRR